MSEYFVGRSDDPAGGDPLEPPIPGMPPTEPATAARSAGAGDSGGAEDSSDAASPEASGRRGPTGRPRHLAASTAEGPEHVRFGIPFNDVVPIWHDGTDITWHRTVDGTDLREVLGLGHVTTEPGPSPTPESWREVVEVGTLVPADDAGHGRHSAAPDVTVPDGDAASDGDPVPDRGAAAPGGAAPTGSSPPEDGPLLRLRAATPSGRRAINDPGDGASVRLSPPLTLQEAMGPTAADFDITGFSTHIGRLMLRAARDGAILLFTMRAPRDPEAHHLLSVPSDVDARRVMHFHLGTLLEMEGGAWDRATHTDGMALLDLDVPYASLLTGAGPESEQGLDVERLVEAAQPVVDCLLKPGFPFALGCSFVLRTDAAEPR